MFGHQNLSHFPQLERSNGSLSQTHLPQPGIDMASEAEYHRNMDHKKVWMRCCEAKNGGFLKHSEC